ncbi:MAG: hypothetical protein VKP57_06905 [Candidatus Sericytochromatia bacterium]|nr:hypothetical protein [Candidatus Sericytochromatia bacterium]
MQADELRPSGAPVQGRPAGRLRALTRALAGLTDWLPQRYASGLDLQAAAKSEVPRGSGLLGALQRIGRTLRDALVRPFQSLADWAAKLAQMVVARFFTRLEAQREEDRERERALLPDQLREQAARVRERERQRVLAEQVSEARRREREALSR